jgi:hypothetical protein
MIRLQLQSLNSVADAQSMLQTAIGVEFGTLPPYLYMLYSIKAGKNSLAVRLIKSVALQEMIHMCLASNILNALGGIPTLKPQKYPGPLPGEIGPDGTPLTLHLLPFSKEAASQGMAIEEPENAPDFPIKELALEAAPKAVTIGQFYRTLDEFLSTLLPSDWQPGRNQIIDNQFFPGQLFAVNGYADAHKAIQEIVSEGEGSRQGTVYDPLDFQDEIAHYFRFGEIFHGKVLTKDNNPQRYSWGPSPLEVDWTGVYPTIADPGEHDFSKDPPAAQTAQNACNQAYSKLVDALQRALGGQSGALGESLRAMYELRLDALHAFTVPLADGSKVAGPAFLYTPVPKGGIV